MQIMQRMRKSQAEAGVDRLQMVSNYSTVTEYSYPTQYLTFLDYRPVLKQIKHSKNLTIWVNTQYNLGNYPNKGIVLCR